MSHLRLASSAGMGNGLAYEHFHVHEYTFQLREVTEVVMAEYRRRPYTDLE